MNIVVTNGYSWLNKGDAGIALALFDSLRDADPDCRITFVSMTPRLDRERYQVPGLTIVGESVERLFDKSRPKALRAADLAWQAASSGQGTDYRAAIRGADAVVACGGGYLNDSWGQVFQLHVAQLRAAKAEGVPYALANQSIGPFHSKAARWSVGPVLRSAATVIPRETISEEVVRSFDVDPARSVLAPDLAFSLSTAGAGPEAAKAAKAILDVDGPRFGVTVREWSFRGQPDPKASQERYYDAVAKAVGDELAAHGGTALFLPQVIGPRNDDDRIAAEIVAARLPESVKAHARVVRDDLDPRAMRHVLAGLDFLVGTRMHSNIFALTEGTPVVAIGYEHKTLGIMQMMGLDDLYTDINTVQAAELSSRIESVRSWAASRRAATRARAASFGAEARRALQTAVAAMVDA